MRVRLPPWVPLLKKENMNLSRFNDYLSVAVLWVWMINTAMVFSGPTLVFVFFVFTWTALDITFKILE